MLKSLDKKQISRIFTDMYLVLLKWLLWAVGVVVGIYLLVAIFFEPIREMEYNVLSSLNGLANGFMIVVGIIVGVYCLQVFIRLGNTRMNFFIGTALAGTAVAFSIQVIGLMLTFGMFALEAVTPLTAGREMMSYLGFTYGYPATVLISCMLLSSTYLQGWIIGAAYYRFRYLGVAGAVILSILITGFVTGIWDHDSSIRVMNISFPLPAVQELSAAVLLNLLIIAFQATLLFMTLRRVPVKVR